MQSSPNNAHAIKIQINRHLRLDVAPNVFSDIPQRAYCVESESCRKRYMTAKANLGVVPPKGEKWKVRERRRPNREIRTKEYLTEAEMERLIEAAKGNRWGFRDATLLLAMYRHGLRASEVIDLRWDGIAAYCKPENKVSLGFVERLTNKIRVLPRRPCGRRDQEYLRLKVLTCMLPAL